MTPVEILALPMQANGADATTVRGYLVKLLFRLWDEGEGFSGKRPFGDSGWEYDLYYPLVRAGLVEGTFDQFGFLEEFPSTSRRTADRLIAEAIQALGT